jgi:hypothetical protein
MSQKIIRIYGSSGQASKVNQHLRDQGFQDVFQFASPSSGPTARADLITNMVHAQVLKSHAEAYADVLKNGKSMVLIHAPFGSALNVERVMDSYQPTETGIPETRYRPDYIWDDSAPLSSVLGLPVLSQTKLPAETLTGLSSLTQGAAFLSNLLGIPLLKEGMQHRSVSWGLPLLKSGVQHRNSSMGLPLLSHSATPLSSLLGLPVLSRRH